MLQYDFIQSVKEQHNILICLHGLGSSKEDLQSLQFNLPNTSFVFVNGPIKLFDLANSFSWFNLFISVDRAVNFNLEDIKTANLILDEFIKYIITTYKISYNKISLFGFSQGGILAFYNALHSVNTYKATICHSGFYLINDISSKVINTQQKLLLLHGSSDTIVPFFLAEQTIELLLDNNINLQTYINNFDHTITTESLEICNKFLL